MTRFKSEPYKHYKDTETRWLGSIPAHWAVKRVKEEFVSLDYKRIPLSGEERQTMTDAVYDYYGASGIIDKVDNYIFDEPLILIGEDGANLLMRGSSLAFIARGKYWVNNHAHVLRPKKGNLEYLCHLLESFDYTALISGSAQPKLTAGQLSNVLLMIPPLEEQQAIADYLDAKTAQIDRKIELLEAKAEKYADLKQSLINETVTRGLDTLTGTRKTVPMKDSGVEWIGQIPSHWEVVSVKRLAKNQQDIVQTGPFGAQLHASDYVDDGVPLILIRNVNNLWIDDSDIPKVTEVKAKELEMYRLKIGDIVFSRVGSIGRIALVTKREEGWLISGQMLRLRITNSRLDERYLICAFSSGYVSNYISMRSLGSTRESINTEILRECILLVPPSLEQKAIADYLESKTAQIEKIIETIHLEVEKLKELRKTLINDVVTGKIKVYEETIHE